MSKCQWSMVLSTIKKLVSNWWNFEVKVFEDEVLIKPRFDSAKKSALMPQVTECPRAPALRLSERPSNAFQVLLKCASALWWLFEYLRVPNCPFSPLKTFCKITGKGPLYQYIELFKKIFIILSNGYFLRNKICEFYHLLQARFNHSNGFRKLSSNSL